MGLLSVGIDPGGSNSAIAIIDSDLNILKVIKAPFYTTENKNRRNKAKLDKESGLYKLDYMKTNWTDFRKLKAIYEEYLDNDIIYTIERVSARPEEGEKNSFVFGNSLGVHQGMYALLNPIALYEPTPAVWKKELGVSAQKKTSIDLTNTIFEDCLRKDSNLSKRVNKDDNLAEALLLSFYGLKNYVENRGS